MKGGFRQSTAWLHTWAGLVPGWVLYFVFVTGTIGYFHIEISRWMQPEQPLAVKDWPLTRSQMLAKADAYLRRVAPDSREWFTVLPDGRNDTNLRVAWNSSSGYVTHVYDPHTDTFNSTLVAQARETRGGHALYLMHERLHYLPTDIGEFIVFLSTVVLLIALLSGMITHKKILADFFSFRRGGGQRAWLDVHNLTGVLTLPFLLMMTYSGLVFSTYSFFFQSYSSPSIQALYRGDEQAFFADGNESYKYNHAPSANVSSPMLPLDVFVDEAKRFWDEGSDLHIVQVLHPGDINAEVRLRSQSAENGTLLHGTYEQLHFGAVDGELIRRQTAAESRSRTAQSVLYSLHEGLFAGPILRWLYFGSGLLGCIMIGSGLVLWTVKRRRKQEANGKADLGFRLVETLNIGTIAGLLVGVAAYFWANRLLPVRMENRADWEMHCLFIVWGAMFVYAALRSPGRAWVESFAVSAALFAFLPILNALTTDRHLGVTLPAADWVLAGFDLTVLAFGALLGVVAWKVHRRVSPRVDESEWNSRPTELAPQ